MLSVAIFLIVLLSAAHAAGGSHRSRIVTLAVAVLALLLQSVGILSRRDEATMPQHALVNALLGVVSYRLLSAIFRARRMDAETTAAAPCLDLVAGLGWALVSLLANLLQPGRFMASFAPAGVPFRLRAVAGGGAEAFSFSFVTPATLGHGDNVLATGATRVLAVAEGPMGQLDLGVLGARVVGLSVASHGRPADAP